MEENWKKVALVADNQRTSVHSIHGEGNMDVYNKRLLRRINWLYTLTLLCGCLVC
jgi:hypothetical protein